MRKGFIAFLGVLLISYAAIWLWKVVWSDTGVVAQNASHRKMYEILSHERETQQASSRSDRVMPLEKLCDPPPYYCTCWIIRDASGNEDFTQDRGYYHEPRSESMKKLAREHDFALVSLFPLNEKSYSLIGCPFDWSAAKPF